MTMHLTILFTDENLKNEFEQEEIPCFSGNHTYCVCLHVFSCVLVLASNQTPK